MKRICVVVAVTDTVGLWDVLRDVPDVNAWVTSSGAVGSAILA